MSSTKVRDICDKDIGDNPSIEEVLLRMQKLYREDPTHAVRSQEFIKTFHHKLALELYSCLSRKALQRGIKVIEEAPLLGSYKPKDVDIAVVDPYSGPLLTVGVRSQMSSVGKNVLTYYQDIIGESISLQERFPMTTMGYVYLHPLNYIDNGKAKETDVARYSRLYASIASRDDRLYKQQTGSYDQFAYVVVDFGSDEPQIRDDLVRRSVPDVDMSVWTFTERMVHTFATRNVWLEDLFQ